jgi:hypothetical protein
MPCTQGIVYVCDAILYRDRKSLKMNAQEMLLCKGKVRVFVERARVAKNVCPEQGRLDYVGWVWCSAQSGVGWLDHADGEWITRRAFRPIMYGCTTNLECTTQTVRSPLLRLLWCAHRIDGKGCLPVTDSCRSSSLIFVVAARQTIRLLPWRY